MKFPQTFAGVLVLSALLSSGAWSQVTVYEKQGKQGPVFSDRPSEGAAPVNIAPNVNVVESPKIAPQAPPAAPAVAPPYQRLAVDTPADDGTIHSNTGAFTVKAKIEPALRKGDRLRVLLDGNVLPGRYNSATAKITSADWQGAANSDNTKHSLQLVIEDKACNALMESAVSHFYAQRATIRKQAR